jgi:hypothetical protein
VSAQQQHRKPGQEAGVSTGVKPVAAGAAPSYPQPTNPPRRQQAMQLASAQLASARQAPCIIRPCSVKAGAVLSYMQTTQSSSARAVAMAQTSITRPCAVSPHTTATVDPPCRRKAAHDPASTARYPHICLPSYMQNHEVESRQAAVDARVPEVARVHTRGATAATVQWLQQQHLQQQLQHSDQRQLPRAQSAV